MEVLEKVTSEKKATVKNGVGRLIFVALAIVGQVFLILALVTSLNQYAEWINFGTHLLAVILVLAIYSQYRTSSMKTTWIILIIALPVLGIVLYLIFGADTARLRMRRRFEDIDQILMPALPENEDVMQELQQEIPSFAGVSYYLKNQVGYPVYRNTEVTYYHDSSEALDAQLRELAKAKSFIFMEYHAIEDKEAWEPIEKILAEKAAAGVEVRLFYDDMGSIWFINSAFTKRMESLGIRCRVFNPLIPIVNLFLNNRDHRKITVIDGRVGFTGGYNLANEYFNITHPYGQWKDSGVRLVGDAVRSMTVIFLEMWNAVKSRDDDDLSFEKYLPSAGDRRIFVRYLREEEAPAAARGFVQPYADSPMDNIHVGEDVYLSLIAKAEKYCYFMTPYLIIEDEMSQALGLAARRGVDVRIITPGIPDKKIVYSVTRSYYHNLARQGVRIYEWTPGFCHAKMCVTDDLAATCGTINLDYRSFYHHFENGCLMVGCPAVQDIKADFDATFPQCREVTEQYNTGRSRVMRIYQVVLRLFAGML